MHGEISGTVIGDFEQLEDIATPADSPLRIGKESRHYDICLDHTGEPYCILVNSDNGHDMSRPEDESPEPRLAIVYFDFESDDETILEGLSEQVLRVFQRQPDRCHAFRAVISGRSMFLAAVDRGGFYLSKTFDIHDEPAKFIQVIAGMFVADREALAFDKAMFCTDVYDNPVPRS